MRLLKREASGEFSLDQVDSYDTFPYAVLSHTWTDDQEVTYQDIIAGTGKHKLSYQKILFCSDQASRDGVRHFWIDTCCIDKSNDHEVRTAITSMYRWYRFATKCYVHLADVSMPGSGLDERPWEDAFRSSRWFTRGWTLQELIAPPVVEFYTREGVCIGDKETLEHIICEVTNIPIGALRGSPLSDVSIEGRLAWAKHRQTKVEEDIVYCLIGIFEVSMVINYGEGGDHALRRLNITIKQSGMWEVSDVLSLVIGLSAELGLLAAASWENHATRLYLVQDGYVVEMVGNSSGWAPGLLPPYQY